MTAAATVAPTVRPASVRPTRARRLRARAAATAAAAVLALAGPALPAWAHDELEGTTPADGATVEIAPAAVELTFSEPPLEIGSQVQVTGPDGAVVNAGDLSITDTVVSQPLAADLPAGAYTVAWRVTSSDGHPISGELSFTAQSGASEPEPEPTPSEPSEPAATATAAPSTAAPVPTGEPTAGAGTTAAPDAQTADDASSPGATPWVVGAVIVLLVGGTLWWVARRRAAAGPQG